MTHSTEQTWPEEQIRAAQYALCARVRSVCECKTLHRAGMNKQWDDMCDVTRRDIFTIAETVGALKPPTLNTPSPATMTRLTQQELNTLEVFRKTYGGYECNKEVLAIIHRLTSPSSQETETAGGLFVEMREALKRADRFITNGIELGFIRMPDEGSDDPALETPEIIRAVLVKAKTPGASPKPEPFLSHKGG